MHNKHYIKQMEKRSRIGDHTLVVGMDIGSEFNAACFMDKEGNVLERYPQICNSRKGFDYFLTMTLRYSHPAPSNKVKAVDILDGILNENPTSHLLHNLKVAK